MVLEPGSPVAAVDGDENDDKTVSDESVPAETPAVETTAAETASPETAPVDTPVAAPVFTPVDRTGTPAGTRPESPSGPEDGPLLPDARELRANWQRVQASFVDDPHTAVAEAADLVGHVVQALTGALRQRQARLREQWAADDADPDADSGTETGTETGTGPDTERLRVTLQQYRAVFNQICRD
jgi:hypothetical protein